MGWNKVQMPASSGLQPMGHLSSLVRGVIVQDEVNIEIGRNFALDLAQKAHKFPASMPGFNRCDDPTGCYIQSGKERSGGMPIIVMAPTLRAARAHRQDRLAALQDLNLALLIHTEHQRIVGWVHVKRHPPLRTQIPPPTDQMAQTTSQVARSPTRSRLERPRPVPGELTPVGQMRNSIASYRSFPPVAPR
jgi:hypothetical protein